MECDTVTKVCTKCGVGRPVGAFSRDARAKDGLQSKCKVCDAAYSVAHREEIAAKGAAWYLDHREETIVRAMAWQAVHPKEHAAFTVAWHIACPGARRTANHRRRALKSAARGTHTAQDIQDIYNEQDGLCRYCGCEVGDQYHVDHWIALFNGGSNWPENLVVSCPSCNVKKGTKDPEVFIKEQRAASGT